ncbi:MAG: hypothetical protein JSS62_02095 [Verrucomicrobia bacterium]|nr:hypothetical protein [Verrucomicrobiota bacterium]MBS0645607.1 hypothetical protein [Verrucomicrobiota bacterium]
MRKVIAVLCIFSIFIGQNLCAASDTFIDYQNYNHGYCPECNYYPCQCDTGYCPNVNSCSSCPNGAPPCPPEPPACPPPASTCGSCNSYDPFAPVGGGMCGVSICAIAVAIAAVAAAAAIIVGSSNGSN